MFELNLYECKPFLREAAVFIFHDLLNCDNNVKTGISYLLFCKSKFEYLRDVEIRILDPYHDEKLALEGSVFEFWLDLS